MAVALNKISVSEFLDLAGSVPVVDVRSPSEYLAGHIPGAHNIPIFSDAERAAVGTMYKKEGRIPAILEGLKLTGPAMREKLEKGLSLAANGKLLCHCWRGGMRSEAMAWLFSLAGIETEILDGGYKSYRNYLLHYLGMKRKVIVLGGMTGSGKTHILKYLKLQGEQVVDLEGLACHKGSAFGALGQPPQPSTEHFANVLFSEWRNLDFDKPVWVEDESRNIGTVFIPDQFYFNMQEYPVIAIMMDVNTRMPRLLEEYSLFPPEELKKSLLKIGRRMGGDDTHAAIEAVDSGNVGEAIRISLKYYDKAYLFGLHRKNRKNVIFVETATDDISINAAKILEVSRNITW
jgi:tRNA 2-selenouridine synthase